MILCCKRSVDKLWKDQTRKCVGFDDSTASVTQKRFVSGADQSDLFCRSIYGCELSTKTKTPLLRETFPVSVTYFESFRRIELFDIHIEFEEYVFVGFCSCFVAACVDAYTFAQLLLSCLKWFGRFVVATFWPHVFGHYWLWGIESDFMEWQCGACGRSFLGHLEKSTTNRNMIIKAICQRWTIIAASLFIAVVRRHTAWCVLTTQWENGASMINDVLWKWKGTVSWNPDRHVWRMSLSITCNLRCHGLFRSMSKSCS